MVGQIMGSRRARRSRERRTVSGFCKYLGCRHANSSPPTPTRESPPTLPALPDTRPSRRALRTGSPRPMVLARPPAGVGAVISSFRASDIGRSHFHLQPTAPPLCTTPFMRVGIERATSISSGISAADPEHLPPLTAHASFARMGPSPSARYRAPGHRSSPVLPHSARFFCTMDELCG